MKRALAFVLCLMASTVSAAETPLSPLQELHSLLKIPIETFHLTKPNDPYPIVCGKSLAGGGGAPLLSVSLTGLVFVDRFTLLVDGPNEHRIFNSDLDGNLTGYGSADIIIRLGKIDPLQRGTAIQQFVDQNAVEFQTNFTAYLRDGLVPCIKGVLKLISPT